MLHVGRCPGRRPSHWLNARTRACTCLGRWLFIAALGVFKFSPAFAQSTVGEYRGYFRPGHNLTAAVGLQQSRWSLSLPSLEKPLTTERYNLLALVSYGFHFQLFQRTGMVLGTGLQAILDRTSNRGYEPSFGVVLPTILGGFVQSLGANSRLLLLGELGVSWYPYSKWRVAETKALYEGGVLDQLALSAQLDFRLQKRNAFSVIAGWRLSADMLIGEKVAVAGESNAFPSMRHEGWCVALGITRQVTETLTGVQSDD